MVATQDVQALLRDGIDVAKTGDRLMAHTLLAQAIKLDPQNQRAWLWLAVVANDEDEAVSCLDHVLALNPANEDAHRGLARLGRDDPSLTASSQTLEDIGYTSKPAGAFKVDPDAGFEMRPERIPGPHSQENNGGSPDADRTHERLESRVDVLTSEVEQNQSSTVAVELEDPFIVPAEPAPGERPTRILIVDDSPTIRKLVAMTLEKLGYEVSAAADGMEALAYINDDIPDLIFLDITMPRMDGYQLCRTIKNNRLTEHIPIVMLTGRDGLMDKVRGRMAGSEGYLTKPFRPDELVRMVRQHTGK